MFDGLSRHGLGAVDVGAPEKALVGDGVGQDGGAVENGAEPVLGEQPVEERLVPDVTAHVLQAGVAGGVGVEIDAHTGETLVQQPLLQDPPEEACSAGDQDGAVIRSGTRRTPFALEHPLTVTTRRPGRVVLARTGTRQRG